MILASSITSEKGKELVKTANDYINIEFTVHRQKIGAIELYLNHDTEDGCATDEWVLKYYLRGS